VNTYGKKNCKWLTYFVEVSRTEHKLQNAHNTKESILISRRLAFIKDQYTCQPKFSDNFWSEFLMQILQKSYISPETDMTYI